MVHMATSNIGLGIIGLSPEGSWAGRAHVPALKVVPGYEIRALATSRPESAAQAAEIYGVPLAFHDPAELVVRPEVDVVVVAVRVPYHLELVKAALEAGKMVYCEWPLGNGRAEAETMAALAESKVIPAHIGLQGRSSPAIRYIRDLVASDRIGEVISSTLVASAGAWGATIEPRLVYGLDRKNGVSMLTVQFGHTIDSFCWCLGEFKGLSATLATRYPLAKRTDTGEKVPKTIDDQIAITGTLDNGAVAAVHYRSGISQAANFFWEINGSKGDLVITSTSGRLQYADLRIQGTSRTTGALEPLPVPESYKLVADASPSDMFYTLAHAYALMRSDIKLGTMHVPTFADAVVRHRMIEAIERSSDTGSRQSYR
jgi:predicted dehydrogenase